ncbi:MAG: PTS ascorbate transporter subunit IIC [Kofleriaceae bacterium]
MARKPFLVRLDPAVLTAVEAWAADDLRSVNGQIEFLLREALRRAGRKVRPDTAADPADAPAPGRGRTRTGA